MKQVSVVYLVKDPPIDRLTAQVEYMREIADEFIFVVDNRTSQHDVDIILGWPGAKVVEWEWNDDFSAARNAALEHVTRPWTLHLDPDELPSWRMMRHIRTVTDGFCDSDVMGWLYWTPNWWGGRKGVDQAPMHWHLRLFRSGHGKWYRKVHELVEIDGEPEGITRHNAKVLQAPSNAYLIHSKPEDLLDKDDSYYKSIEEANG